MSSWKKTLLNASLSSLLVTGCAYNRACQTFHAQTVSLEEVSRYYTFIRSKAKTGVQRYKSDLCFIMECAKKEKKKFFLFDGTTYPTDETAFGQLDALIKARKAGKSKYTFNGEEKETCSYYSATEQMEIFGNLWEEVRSPQSEETKMILREYTNRMFTRKDFSHFVLNRLYQLCRVSGYPEIQDVRKDHSIIGSVIAGAKGKPISYYLPTFVGRPTINLAPDTNGVIYDDIVCELPHAFRNNNNVFGEIAHFLADGIKDLITLNSPGFGVTAQKKNYKNPMRMEYDAHKIIEPLIKKYLFSPQMSLTDFYHEIEKARTKSGNTYLLTPSAKRALKEKPTEKGSIMAPIFGYDRKIPEK